MKYMMWEPQFGECTKCRVFYVNVRLISIDSDCYLTCYYCWFSTVDANGTVELDIVNGVRNNWDVNTTFTITSTLKKDSKVYSQ